MANARTVDDILNDIIEPIVGDTPVSVQLNAAIDKMASKEDVQILTAELIALRKEVERLSELVGDTTVSEQINIAINNIK